LRKYYHIPLSDPVTALQDFIEMIVAARNREMAFFNDGCYFKDMLWKS